MSKISWPQILNNWFLLPLVLSLVELPVLSTDRKISDFFITFVTYILEFDLHLFKMHLATPLFSHDKDAIWKWAIRGWSFSLLTVAKLTHSGFKDLNWESMDRSNVRSTWLRAFKWIKRRQVGNFQGFLIRNGENYSLKTMFESRTKNKFSIFYFARIREFCSILLIIKSRTLTVQTFTRCKFCHMLHMICSNWFLSRYKDAALLQICTRNIYVLNLLLVQWL